MNTAQCKLRGQEILGLLPHHCFLVRLLGTEARSCTLRVLIQAISHMPLENSCLALVGRFPHLSRSDAPSDATCFYLPLKDRLHPAHSTGCAQQSLERQAVTIGLQGQAGQQGRLQQPPAARGVSIKATGGVLGHMEVFAKRPALALKGFGKLGPRVQRRADGSGRRLPAPDRAGYALPSQRIDKAGRIAGQENTRSGLRDIVRRPQSEVLPHHARPLPPGSATLLDVGVKLCPSETLRRSLQIQPNIYVIIPWEKPSVAARDRAEVKSQRKLILLARPVWNICLNRKRCPKPTGISSHGAHRTVDAVGADYKAGPQSLIFIEMKSNNARLLRQASKFPRPHESRALLPGLLEAECIQLLPYSHRANWLSPTEQRPLPRITFQLQLIAPPPDYWSDRVSQGPNGLHRQSARAGFGPGKFGPVKEQHSAPFRCKVVSRRAACGAGADDRCVPDLVPFGFALHRIKGLASRRARIHSRAGACPRCTSLVRSCSICRRLLFRNIYSVRIMGERNDLLSLWRRARSRGERVALATVVRTEGSSYRKPGARMLVTAAGERAGTISGGCLEAEVSRKIWWLTSEGPVVQRYQSSFDEDEGEIPWGLGCGGTIWVHLEQEPTAVLNAMTDAEAGIPAFIAFTLEPQAEPALVLNPGPLGGAKSILGRKASPSRESTVLRSSNVSTFVEEMLPPPRLTVFGAGDDSIPIAEFAAKLGWRVTVADGRAHLLQSGKFPPGTELRLLTFDQPAPAACAPSCGVRLPSAHVDTGMQDGDLAVILTHSYEQDRTILGSLLPRTLAYLGILGPRHRTQRLLEEIAPTLGWSNEQCFARLHSPVGLDLGARDPAAIALAIVADLQAALTGRRFSVHRDAAPAAALTA